MRYFQIGTLLLLITVQLNAQNITISGKAPDYSTKEIVFYTLPDPVLHEKLELATTRVGTDGNFELTFPVSQTIEIYTDLEKYCGTMVVESGKKYTVTMRHTVPISGPLLTGWDCQVQITVISILQYDHL
jgi:hypothetical protein